jgi:iron(III) transport system permease protein
LPLAALLPAVQLRLADRLLFDAAALAPVPAWRRSALIHLPLPAPGVLAGMGLVGALTMGELSATLLVVPPGHSTLVLRIYNYLHYGASQTVAGLCQVLALAVLAAGGLTAFLVAVWGRFALGPQEGQ